MLPSAENSQNMIVESSQKGNKTPKFILIIFCAVLFIFLLISGYLLKVYGTSSLVPQGRIAGYDTRLWKYYFSTRKLNSDNVINFAKNDCLEVKPTQQLENTLPNYFTYTKSLEQKLLSNIGITPEKSIDLLFVYVEVPNTDKCWLIWAIDLKGRGVVGYESKSGKMQLYSSNLPKDRLDGILKDITIPI